MKTDAALGSRLGLVVALAALLCIPAQVLALLSTELERISQKGLFRVQIRSSLQPVTINQMHRWLVYLEDAEGKPVTDASIDVTGSMPRHDHGLPTRPMVRADKDDGTYLIEGLRFHMPGEWQLAMTIYAGGSSDSLVISFRL